MVRYPSPQMFDQFRIPKERYWQIDRDFDVTVASSEIAPSVDPPANHKLRHRAHMGTIVRHDRSRRHGPQSRMTDRHECFGAAQRERAHIDLRLIPEFERVDRRSLRRGHRMVWRRFDGRE